MVSSLASARSTPSGVDEHVVELLLGDAVAEQRPLEVLLGPLLEAALAGEVLEVEDVAEVVGHLAVPLGDVGAVAEGGREDDLRDVALVDQAVAEVGGRGRAVVAGRERGVGVDLRRQALVAEALAVRALDVDEVPGDVAGLELGAELGHRLVRALVPGEVGAGQRRVGLGVGLLLRGLVGAAPGHDGHRVGAVLAGRQVLRAGRDRQRARRRRRRVAVVGSFGSPCAIKSVVLRSRRGPGGAGAAVVRRRRARGSPRSASRPWSAAPTCSVGLARLFGTLTMKSPLPCDLRAGSGCGRRGR